MEIITGNEHDLKQLIEGAYRRLDCCKDNMERYVLIDYLYQLHDAEDAMITGHSELDEERCFRSNTQQRKYVNYIDSLFARLDEEFIKFKHYHRGHFDEMLYINDNELEDLVDEVFCDGYKTISKEEFSQYFYEFLCEYKLEDFFDKFITGRKIFNRSFTDAEKYTGTVLHDPMKKKSSIMLCDFECTVPYLLTLGHEFGHTYDLNKLSRKDLNGYMKYSYSSVYGETISMMFEKLFYDFLFKKKYYLDDVKEIYTEFSFEGMNYVLDSYILSLLNDETIRNISLDSFEKKDILKQVSSSFTRLDEVEDHISDRRLDTWKCPLYAYGDYFSTILKDNVQNEGLDSKMMRTFLDIRKRDFSPEDLEYYGFDMDAYQKVYKKDISRLKK